MQHLRLVLAFPHDCRESCTERIVREEHLSEVASAGRRLDNGSQGAREEREKGSQPMANGQYARSTGESDVGSSKQDYPFPLLGS